jgi:hypothetical protein
VRRNTLQIESREQEWPRKTFEAIRLPIVVTRGTVKVEVGAPGLHQRSQRLEKRARGELPVAIGHRWDGKEEKGERRKKKRSEGPRGLTAQNTALRFYFLTLRMFLPFRPQLSTFPRRFFFSAISSFQED